MASGPFNDRNQHNYNNQTTKKITQVQAIISNNVRD